MTFRRGPASQSGLTLVEVILCIAILAFGIVSVQRAFLGAMSALGVVENWELAEGLIQKKIWEIERDVKERGRSIQSINGSGLLIGANRSYRYEISSKPLDAEGSLGAVRIKLFDSMGSSGRAVIRDFYVRIPYADKA